jgi:large repetitive protein
VGSYAYTIGNLDAGTNYTTSFIGGTYSITPATLNITAVLGQGKIFGNDDPLRFNYTFSGLFSGDSISGHLERVNGESVGNYAYTIGSLNAGGNYNLTLTPGVFTIISPAAVFAGTLELEQAHSNMQIAQIKACLSST